MVTVRAFIECGVFKFVRLSDVYNVGDTGITSRPENGRAELLQIKLINQAR